MLCSFKGDPKNVERILSHCLGIGKFPELDPEIPQWPSAEEAWGDRREGGMAEVKLECYERIVHPFLAI